MTVFEIKEGRIRIRPATGDQFEFSVVRGAGPSVLRLSRPPRWLGDKAPSNAELRIFLSHAAAQHIARGAGLIGQSS